MQRRHLGVYGVIKQDDCFLLIKKARGPYTDRLDLPGGNIEFGETPEQTLIREIDEETGQKVLSFELLFADSIRFEHNITKDNSTEDLHHICIVYSVIIEQNIDLKISADGLDSNGSTWFNPLIDDIDNLTPFAKKAVVEYRTKLA